MKKRLLALMLVVAMVMGMSMTTFAAVEKSDAKTITFEKVYKTTNGEAPATYPREAVDFKVVADNENPSTVMINVVDIDKVDANPDVVTIEIPGYSVVGKYNYTISEEVGNTQGVGYSNATFNVQVFATYNADFTKIETAVEFTTPGENGKVDEIVNTYDLGSLAVTKEVTGNLGNKEKEFDVAVRFTKEENKTVASDITYTEDGTLKTITADKFTDGYEEVVIKLKDAETITFNNIPAGITYTVVENAKHLSGDVNGSEGYTAEYEFSDTADTKTISADDNDTVKITNEKKSTIDTGIIVNNFPYIIALAAVAVALVALMRRRRSF